MKKQDNKSTLTGLLLIGIIFVAYSIFFPPIPEEKPNTDEPNQTEDITNEGITIPESTSEDNLPKENGTKDIIDTTKIVTEKFYTLENNKIKLVFTNKGGEIKSAIIKDFYTYDEYKKNLDDNTHESQDIEIFNNQDSKFEIFDDRNIFTNEFFDIQEKSDQSITFKWKKNGVFIEYTYTLNKEEENFVDLTINSEGITHPELVWTIAVPETEKSKTNQELGTGFYYQEEHSKDVSWIFDNEEFERNDFERISILILHMQ